MGAPSTPLAKWSISNLGRTSYGIKVGTYWSWVGYNNSTSMAYFTPMKPIYFRPFIGAPCHSTFNEFCGPILWVSSRFEGYVDMSTPFRTMTCLFPNSHPSANIRATWPKKPAESFCRTCSVHVISSGATPWFFWMFLQVLFAGASWWWF